MSTPKSPEELTTQIEQLVECYLAESRNAARRAVERAFGAIMPASKSTRRSTNTAASRHPGGQRRSVEELERVAAALYEQVRANPGESMVSFATELQTSVRALQRPMTLLKKQGRVRSVGQRHRTRYFPAVGKAARTAS
ncbi:MAG: winged helix-turn-helix domain-containing protein [Myxococcales bacterium]|nr:winged helix-turn-helix domain-containing protein [Myxococcales bacterium]